ncbi:MAG: NUDIX domain-containing protein [Hyphomonadaceae bacterium]
MSTLLIRFERPLRGLRQAFWRFTRGTTLGVRGVVTDAQGRVLLVRHTYAPGWYFPGGGVEKRETAEAALARELAEEGGVEPESAPVLFGFYANHAIFPNDHVALYRVERWRPCASASEGEIAERGFFAPDALPDGVTPARAAGSPSSMAARAALPALVGRANAAT